MIFFQQIIGIAMINFCMYSGLSLSTQSHTTNKLRLTSHLSAKSSYWKRLGEPKTVIAPMVAQSDLAFRRLVRNHGTDLAFTQMIHAHNFVSSKAFQDSYLDVYKDKESIVMTPSGINALDDLDWDDWKRNGLSDRDLGQKFLEQQGGELNRWSSYYESGPLVVQIAGHDPHTLSNAAKIILERTNSSTNKNNYEGPVSGIDVNCGCPQGIARKGRYGAFLMEESLDTVCNIISRLRQDLPTNVGVSCKIRIPNEVGTPGGNAILKSRIERLIDAGCELITVHGRTLKENKTAVRECNWDAIAQVVDIAKTYSGYDYPIIANGGIEFSSDVSKCECYIPFYQIMGLHLTT
jgi:tRNA-dihydrouridine synthase 1